MREQGYCNAHPAPPQGGTGILKIGKALGIGTGTGQRVVMEQPRPFDVDVAEPRPGSERRSRSDSLYQSGY